MKGTYFFQLIKTEVKIGKIKDANFPQLFCRGRSQPRSKWCSLVKWGGAPLPILQGQSHGNEVGKILISYADLPPSGDIPEPTEI